MNFLRKGLLSLFAVSFVEEQELQRESASIPCDCEAAIGLGLCGEMTDESSSSSDSKVDMDVEEVEEVVEEVVGEEAELKEEVATPPLPARKKKREQREPVEDDQGAAGKKVLTLEAGVRRVRDTRNTKITAVTDPAAGEVGNKLRVERPSGKTIVVPLYADPEALIEAIKGVNISPVDSVQLATNAPEAYWNAVHYWAGAPGNVFKVDLIDAALTAAFPGGNKRRRGRGAGGGQ